VRLAKRVSLVIPWDNFSQSTSNLFGEFLEFLEFLELLTL
jgi:hypothetical protein